MAVANIQITQGANVGAAGQSIAGCDPTTSITLTDAGGAGAASYLWECVSWPAPDSGAPTIGSSTSQVASIAPPGGGFTDGVYIIRLTRNDPSDGVTSQVRFFAVSDADGYHLPSAGMSRSMTNINGVVAAQAGGWMGSDDGGSNFFLDAFLRTRRLREGSYSGRSTATSHASGSPVTATPLVYGSSRPFQRYTLTGAGAFTVELSTAGAVEDGSTFTIFVTSTAGAGNFILKSGVGGSTILTVPAPHSGTSTMMLTASFFNSVWNIWPTSGITEGSSLVFRAQTISNVSTLVGFGSSGMDIGPAQRTTTGAGTTLTIHGQAVQTGQEGTSKAGDINFMLGRVIGTGAQDSGSINFYDHLGPAVKCHFAGVDGVGGGTSGMVVTGAAAGVDGRARNVSLSFVSPVQVAFAASSADLTLDSVAVRFRLNSVNRMEATVSSTTCTTSDAGYIASEWAGGTGLHKRHTYWNRVQTTDATVTTAFTSPTIANSTVVHVSAVIVAANNLGTQGATYKRDATFRCTSGGSLVLVGSVTSVHTGEDTAGWDATLDSTGATFRVRVTGAAATNIGWESYVEISYGGPHA